MNIKIIDASVAIKWFAVNEKWRDKALFVLEDVLNSPKKFAVPELFYYEILNVVNRIGVFDKNSNALFGELLDIGINRFSVSDNLVQGIYKYQKLGLSGYDGAYAALAEDLGGEWLTFDKKAHAKVKKLNISRLL